jgi:ATP synthase protein I
MQTYDAHLVRAAALPAAALTAAAMSVSAVSSGVRRGRRRPGWLLVAAFFGSSHLLAHLGRNTAPTTTMSIALGGYTAKVFVLAVALTLLAGTTAFDRMAFGVTAILVTTVWLVAEVRAFTRLKIPTIQLPEGGPDAR